MINFPNSISHYKFIEPIGRGSTSEVLSAICLDNQNEISIKKIDMEKYPIELEFLRQEVSFWSSSAHPNVVGYYGSFVEGTVIYILMEYCSAGSIYDIMRYGFPRGFNDEFIIATILKGVLNALNYIHSNGQIHRDIKPGNILLCADGSVKIGDFGVAASLFQDGQRQRARYTVIGTPCYMAPEVLTEDHGYTEKADIWSLGITAIELATGEAPYSKLKPMEIMVKILKSPPSKLPTNAPYSAEFRNFVEKCLQSDPMNRATAEELLRHPFIAKAKSDSYISATLLTKIPPIGERLRTIEKQFSAFSMKEQTLPPQAEHPPSPMQWNFEGIEQPSHPHSEPTESITKGRFTITKQPSSGQSNLSEADKENQQLKQTVRQLQQKVESMECEMDQMKDQIRLLTQLVQNIMK
ncbi:STE family protein kinase [Trichomonas vaginalis G3]|uniref:STE family protein kinase n=1 Tax=Trichomonas vaginalis (strain ATCC PRA-98 / G3) TaxID=412133 RepID=A2EWX1_TRIV3|nr:STKc OSR1 SPAK domain-containing protein [Trichomonas vaginalis G3]EAY02813.1 STE family protein kinase [Trichomonas vaginalis G3]KAI5525651.1 STKc OSR1 SPAK domain-containing protein [Trichomonas vaginalis G3]|eukprot:XP_001315036.1 STE family protein kinase [Trichomonas vaginalis G3]